MDANRLKKIKIVILALEDLEYDDKGDPKFNKRLKCFTNLVNHYYSSYGKISQDEVSEIMNTSLKDLFNVRNIEI